MPGDMPPRHPEQPGMRMMPLSRDGDFAVDGNGATGASALDPPKEKSQRQSRPDGQDHVVRVLATLGIFLSFLAWQMVRGTDAEKPIFFLGAVTATTCALTLVLNIYICWVVRNWYECRACEDTGLFPPGLTYGEDGRVIIPRACECGRGRNLGAADMDAIMAELRMRND